ncbi:MAG: hypothetical protein IJT41_10970 [Clostridia bacterium]|nr:hypothetical protein [Clostridia bacterium]
MILGIDGGGTKTTAALFETDGTFLSQAEAGSINTHSNALLYARRNLQIIMDSLRADVGKRTIRSAFIGSSALNSVADEDTIRALTSGILDAEMIGMDSDLAIALESMRCDEPCAVAICGTGSMAVGRDAGGLLHCKGGYGYLLGDEGSGYAISVDAIRAGLRSADGSARRTKLEETLFDFFQVSDTNALIDLVYDKPLRRQDLAAFLPVVAECADSGDETACEILRMQAQSFADTVKALLEYLPPDCPIGLWGGVFCHVPYFTACFKECISGHTIGLLPYPPQIGAVFAAFRQCGIRLTDEVLQRIQSSYPNQDV